MGFALQPLGISKNRDTPTWCLYCTGANLLIALLLYWLADVKGWSAWANFAKPAGANPLLPYMLAYVPFLLPPLYRLNSAGTFGSWGVIKSALLTILALLITRGLLRIGVTLRV
jgi:predicted acyltransferase